MTRRRDAARRGHAEDGGENDGQKRYGDLHLGLLHRGDDSLPSRPSRRRRQCARDREAPLSSPFAFQPVALALGETDRKKSTARRSRVESEAPLADELQALLGASRGLAEGLAGGGAAPVS